MAKKIKAKENIEKAKYYTKQAKVLKGEDQIKALNIVELALSLSIDSLNGLEKKINELL